VGYTAKKGCPGLQEPVAYNGRTTVAVLRCQVARPGPTRPGLCRRARRARTGRTNLGPDGSGLPLTDMGAFGGLTCRGDCDL